MWASAPTEGQEVRGRRDDVGIVPYGELQGVRYKAVGADDSVRPVHSFFPFRGDPHKKSPLL